VHNEGGYQNMIGDWQPVLNLLDDASLMRTITSKVFDDTKEGDNGDSYSIIAGHFIINVTDANAIAASAAAVIEAEFLTRSGAESFKRSGTMNILEGTRKLVSAVAQGGTATFASRAGSLVEGDKFDVVFWVDEDHTATVTVTLTVSNRTAPVLTVPAKKFVPLNASFPEGSYADTTPSYMQGVSVYDAEDGGALTAAAITHDTPVDTSVDGASYTVTYSVTDSDHNTTKKTGLVLVGDWIDLGDYVVFAKDFTKKLSDVEGTEAEVLRESQAKAIDAREWLDADGTIPNPNFGKEVKVNVNDDGGYYSKKPSTDLPNGFEIVLIVNNDDNATFKINVRVDDNRVMLTYYANGGAGAAPAKAVSFPGNTVVVSDQASLYRTGYTFGGWSFTGNGGAAYQAGNTFRMYEDTNLYAVWVPVPVIIPNPDPIIIPVPYPVAGPTYYITTPGQTIIVPAPTPTTQPEEPEQKKIEDEKVPLDLRTWSLVDLVCTILLALALLASLIRYVRRPKVDDDEYDDTAEERDNRVGHTWATNIFLILVVAAAVAVLVLFILTQDLTLKMALFDSYSAAFIGLLAAGIIFTIALFVSVYLGKKMSEEDTEDNVDAVDDFYATLETEGIA